MNPHKALFAIPPLPFKMTEELAEALPEGTKLKVNEESFYWVKYGRDWVAGDGMGTKCTAAKWSVVVYDCFLVTMLQLPGEPALTAKKESHWDPKEAKKVIDKFRKTHPRWAEPPKEEPKKEPKTDNYWFAHNKEASYMRKPVSVLCNVIGFQLRKPKEHVVVFVDDMSEPP